MEEGNRRNHRSHPASCPDRYLPDEELLGFV